MTLAFRYICGPLMGRAAAILTLPAGRPATEHRAAYPHVCRAASDRRLEVAAHARRHPGGGRVDEPDLVGDVGERGERGKGILTERRHAHDPAQPQPLRLR